MATPISNLRNLGPRVEEYMAKAGIYSAEELRVIGYLQGYLRVRALQPKIMNRMALYAIYGALSDQDCMRLPREIKDALEVELQAALAEQKITPQHHNTLPLHELP
jgi:DNA transformation protein